MHRIELEPFTGTGEKAQRYRIWHDGAVLIENTWNPEYDACRALAAKGITGKAEFWRKGGTAPCSRVDIERGARTTVADTVRGLHLCKWTPFDGAIQEQGLPYTVSALAGV